jgi:hypothetical protein
MSVSIWIAHSVLEDVGHILEEAGFELSGAGSGEGEMSREADLTGEEEARLIKEMGEAYFCFSNPEEDEEDEDEYDDDGDDEEDDDEDMQSQQSIEDDDVLHSPSWNAKNFSRPSRPSTRKNYYDKE